ncbi:MAG: hypothetical protein ACRDT0_07465 [Pseudonocardiaceae bacterium]
MASKAGREAFEVIRFFGPAETQFSIGYKVTEGGARHRGGTRYIRDLDLYEVSPVRARRELLRRADLEPRVGATLECKATSDAATSARRRSGHPTVVPCSTCGRPAAGIVNGGLLRGTEEFVCRGYLRGLADDVRASLLGEPGTGTTVIRAGELAETAAVSGPTAEAEYVRAPSEEIGQTMRPDGTVVLGADDPARTGRASQRRGVR